MCPRTTRSFAHILGYSLPQFHPGKQPYVDFNAINPATGELKRKKYHISPKLKKKEQYQAGCRMVAVLSEKLAGGWSPWMETTEGSGLVRLDKAIERYLKHIERYSRKKTVQSYTSRVNVFREFLATLNPKVEFTCQLERKTVLQFLDYILLDRGNGERTRNNYLGWMISFCEWMTERGLMESNPASGISKMRQEPKKRQPLTPEMMVELAAYLETAHKAFKLAVLMEYYVFIRPSELVHLKVGDIDREKRKIYVSGEFSKNRRDGAVAIPNLLLEEMEAQRIFDYPDSLYLFSTNFQPGKTPKTPDAFNKEWHKVRKVLKWPDVYQFYSLKDTGLKDLANEKGIVVARDQARHSDISTTNKYLQGRDREAPGEVLEFDGALGGGQSTSG